VYETVFDISQKGFDWWFPLAGLGFVVIGAGLIWLSRRYSWPLSKSWGGIFYGCLRLSLVCRRLYGNVL
jgi:hypothetical protein